MLRLQRSSYIHTLINHNVKALLCAVLVSLNANLNCHVMKRGPLVVPCGTWTVAVDHMRGVEEGPLFYLRFLCSSWMVDWIMTWGVWRSGHSLRWFVSKIIAKGYWWFGRRPIGGGSSSQSALFVVIHNHSNIYTLCAPLIFQDTQTGTLWNHFQRSHIQYDPIS